MHDPPRTASNETMRSFWGPSMLPPPLFTCTAQREWGASIHSHNHYHDPRTSISTSSSVQSALPTLATHPPRPIDTAEALDTRPETVRRRHAPPKSKTAAVPACAGVIQCRPRYSPPTYIYANAQPLCVAGPPLDPTATTRPRAGAFAPYSPRMC